MDIKYRIVKYTDKKILGYVYAKYQSAAINNAKSFVSCRFILQKQDDMKRWKAVFIS